MFTPKVNTVSRKRVVVSQKERESYAKNPAKRKRVSEEDAKYLQMNTDNLQMLKDHMEAIKLKMKELKEKKKLKKKA